MWNGDVEAGEGRPNRRGGDREKDLQRVRKGILNSGFWIPDSDFWILDSGSSPE
jgi:hypothetical protein